ncbi:hypothetical protein EJ05DRAFT_472126 [Pseudovirgaria hyperparasitica]|uniref:Uncharacterized protein n=1 Tax=Pseudovirgaria hyperparasitica TaxID=470096 RepID=A0A6A6WLY8_9PEZI|nr:uncharacterized protein EJ05DRAFT_472126 [Pseudovirgaria hyperparasitica]KAF2763215.1 hypothetical protein EJ05DRAFT_472126 [Pseudovirgaria hyperparasitica]
MARSAYSERSDSGTTASGRSHHSDDSYYSRSTAPTDLDVRQYDYLDRQLEPCNQEQYQQHSYEKSRESVQSVDTYTSTDEEEIEDADDERPAYEVPPYSHHEVYPTDAIPTTPQDFGRLFPSTKRLVIRHDDATMDGNMNLRVDTGYTTRDNRRLTMTLFHLRMHDLRSRDFSLRRYCRESGREVCHSIRKYEKPPADRPSLQRSMSSALGVFRLKSDSRPATASGMTRADSGYESVRNLSLDDDTPNGVAETSRRARQLIPTQTIKLEFSNYAHVNVKRRGAGSNKRYTFEYWGIKYNWRRTVRKDGSLDIICYHLMRDHDDAVVAQMVPMRLTLEQRHEEAAKGGWIPPSYLRILDPCVLENKPDISDIVVSSALVALVDDNIKRRFHSKQTTQLQIPLPLSRNGSWKMNVDYVGPKRLIDEMFHKR